MVTGREIYFLTAAYVYLIHLDHKIKHSQHYLGYTALDSVEKRFNRHRSGNGSRFLAHANQLKINYSVVRVWECNDWKEARKLERRFKSWHNSSYLCPVCNGSSCNGK